MISVDNYIFNLKKNLMKIFSKSNHCRINDNNNKMKNIFLLFFTVTTILSCSNSDTNENTTIPAELIGTWQFKGIYSFDVVDENDMPLYTAYENGGFITF